MRQWDPQSRLLQGEQLISSDAVPFIKDTLCPSLSELVERMTVGGTKMPLASYAINPSSTEGLFQAEFGRDALVMAALVDECMPELTEVVVRRLAELQGVRDQTMGGRRADGEEVGRIPHEHRPETDPIAISYSKLYGWQWPYFGSIDATPLFISAVARAALRNPAFLDEQVLQRDNVTRPIRTCLTNALAWLNRYLDEHPLGLLDCEQATNGCWQVWMDSVDAYHDEHGVLARGRLASIEVQAFVYDALIDVSILADLIAVDGDACRERAERLRESVFFYFAIDSPEHGLYMASAVERIGEVCHALPVRTANMGMLLASSMLDGDEFEEYVAAIEWQLLDADGLFSHSGIRTLAKSEARFRPYSYHNGSVWPWQNLWIANGFRRHGRNEPAVNIEAKMQQISAQLGCMPEFVQGEDSEDALPVENVMIIKSLDGRDGAFQHTLTQPAQKYQGWTVFGLYAVQARMQIEHAVA